ncbi:MAG TPA: transposase, partial [Casimicrobiaceae bacterium]
RWVACRPGFFLPVRVLSRLFRRRFLEELVAAHRASQLQFFGDDAGLDERGVTFRWKDYRATGKTRYKAMTLAADEFMRRFLLHVLPSGFHRIRHYGLLANAERREHLARVREQLHVVPVAEPQSTEAPVANVQPTFICPHCGAAMSIIEIFARGQPIRAPLTLRAAA